MTRLSATITESGNEYRVTFIEEEDSAIVFQKLVSYKSLEEAQAAAFNFQDEYSGFLPFED